jgi:hypothetical protein
MLSPFTRRSPRATGLHSRARGQRERTTRLKCGVGAATHGRTLLLEPKRDKNSRRHLILRERRLLEEPRHVRPPHVDLPQALYLDDGQRLHDLLRRRTTDAELGPEGFHVEEGGEWFAHRRLVAVSRRRQC